MLFKTTYETEINQLFSIDFFLSTYFFGIPLPVLENRGIKESTLRFYITSATRYIGEEIGIIPVPTKITENKDFNRGDYFEWGHLRLSYPVMKVLRLDGFVGTIRQLTYPIEWVDFINTSREHYGSRINIIPIHQSAQFSVSTLAGLVPSLGFQGYGHIPNYWSIEYITGFREVPSDIINAIGKYASINLFNILGDIVIGAGIASKSIGFDGLSESISTTSSAENAAYSARIRQYERELKEELKKLTMKYKGISYFSA